MAADLLEALNSTADDLQLNRAGVLSQRQQRQLDSYVSINTCGTKMAAGALIATLVVAAAVLYRTQDQPGMDRAWPVIVMVVAGFALLFGGGIVGGIIRSRELRTRTIREVSGVAERSTRAPTTKRHEAFYLKISNVRFQLSTREQYDAFTEGARYRIFYIHYPPTHIIVSAERLS